MGRGLTARVLAGAVAILAASALFSAPASALTPRVVHGHDADPHAFPFTVALLEAERVSEGIFEAQFCGGALTTSRTVVTAAHCIVDQKSGRRLEPADLLIGIGSNLRSGDMRTVHVQEVAVHPDYSTDTAENDIAVVTLADAVPDVPVITPMRPTDLKAYVQEGAKVRVVGWGNTSSSGNSFPDRLRVGNLIVFPDSACGENVPYVLGGIEFDGFDPDEANAAVMVCAAGVTSAGKVIDACQGDSGSPLVGGEGVATRLVGLVSWGEDCATRHPGVYTRVAAMTDFLVAHQAIATLAPTVAPALSVDALHDSVRVTFVPAPDGSSVTAFAATAVGPDGGVHSCFTTPRRDRLPAQCEISGLADGTAYAVSGIAANVLGDSPASAAISATPIAVPSAGRITKVQVIPGGLAAFTVRPSRGNGTALASVRVACLPLRGGPGRSAKVVDGVALVTGLEKIRYRCATVARNSVGTASSRPRLVIGRP